MIDMSQIRDMDYVLTTSKSPISYLIRLKENWRKWRDLTIATHAGILFESEGYWWIAEMALFDKCDSFKRTSILHYINQYKGDRIVSVRRNPVYDDIHKRLDAKRQMIDDLYHCKGYDLAGIVEFVFPKIKDKSQLFYCSEIIAHYSNLSGKPLTDNPNEDDISPYGLQISPKLGRIYDV